jgi:glyoxylase-like metal-dependent hydrolase (beta-lactamase superfamily II)
MNRRVVAISMLLAGLAVAQERDWAKIEEKVVPVAGGVSMLVGDGGNIGVTTGKDGIFIIDDQFEPLLPKIRAALKTLADGPVRFVVNTHFHGDHTGSNARLREAGAVIIAQENVRKRLGMERLDRETGKTIPPKPPESWPLLTYANGVNLYLNGDELEVTHVARAHTDGDSIIRFKKANVVHMGDTFFNGGYPFIDVDSGGSIDGAIAAVDQVLATVDDRTKIIPGHGPLANKADLQTYRNMLASTRDRVKTLIAQGKTLDQIVAAKPTAQWDAKWGKEFMPPDIFVSFVHRSLTEKPAGTR